MSVGFFSDRMRDERLGRRAIGERPSSIEELCRRLTVHATARAGFVTLGEARLARGATVIASVTALTLAVSPTETEATFADKLSAIRDYVGGLREPHRTHVALLAEAALSAGTALRTATGLPPHGLRIGGWMDGVPASSPREVISVPPDDMRSYATAGEARLVDVALDHTVAIIRHLVALAMNGEPREGTYDLLSEVAFVACVEPATTRACFEDARGARQILWRTLRRRRPIAAAVIRACLLHDGRRSRALPRSSR